MYLYGSLKISFVVYARYFFPSDINFGWDPQLNFFLLHISCQEFPQNIIIVFVIPPSKMIYFPFWLFILQGFVILWFVLLVLVLVFQNCLKESWFPILICINFFAEILDDDKSILRNVPESDMSGYKNLIFKCL